MTGRTRTVTVGVVQCSLTASRPERISRRPATRPRRSGARRRHRPRAGALRGPLLLPRRNSDWFAEARPVEATRGWPECAKWRSSSGSSSRCRSSARRPGVLQQPCRRRCRRVSPWSVSRSHIPDGPGYEESSISSRRSGFPVWAHAIRKIGVGIWDWVNFPESARTSAPRSRASLLSDRDWKRAARAAEMDTRDPWQRADDPARRLNVVPVVASNRTGNEGGQIFYGSSFIADHRGDKVAELSRTDEGVAVAGFDLDALARTRASWGFFRDRRPELYDVLTTGRRYSPRDLRSVEIEAAAANACA